jgi:RNA recognition motif-containing protein
LNGSRWVEAPHGYFFVILERGFPMGNKLYVGNLAYSVRDDSLEQAFAQFGAVTSAKVMMDRETGRSKGFGFVEMGSDAEAQAAINGMNGQPLEGRAIVVNEARPREERPGGFRSGGFGGGGGGGGYGGGGGGGGRGGFGGGGGGGGGRSPYGNGGRSGGGGGYGGGGRGGY